MSRNTVHGLWFIERECLLPQQHTPAAEHLLLNSSRIQWKGWEGNREMVDFVEAKTSPLLEFILKSVAKLEVKNKRTAVRVVVGPC